jgi:streptomycin 6-kinase
LSYNFVAYVTQVDGAAAVLKIGVPNPELMTEIEALRAYQGKPIVELLEADRQLGALLLKRVIPGTPLSKLDDDEEATAIGAQLIGHLPAPAPTEHQFPTVARWAQAFDRLRVRFDGKTGPLPARMVEKAERLFEELEASSPVRRLLHGDLHHDNILCNGKESWVAIDPKGVIGDPAYEAARFQHNPIPGFLGMDDLEEAVKRRVEIIASILQEDRSRLLAWAFFDAMLSTCWCIEEDALDWRDGLLRAEVLDGALTRVGGA